MLETFFSRTSHIVLSLIITTIISIWLGAGIFILPIAWAFSWFVYRNSEIMLIERSHELEDSNKSFPVSVVFIAVLGVTAYVISSNLLGPESYGWFAVLGQVSGAAVAASSLVSTLFSICIKHQLNKSQSELKTP